MLTVTTNVLGVFTVPFILNAVLNSAPGADSGAGAGDAEMAEAASSLLLKLVISIIVPMAAGKTVREKVGSAPGFAKKYKVELGLTNNSALIAIVWMSISKSRGMLVGESALNICVIVLAGIGLHVVLLAANWTATTPVLRLPEKERRAVLLMASQKTLPVAVTVISYLDEARWGGHGLIAIPCIVGHVSQLFIDAFIAGKWAAASAKSLDDAAAAEANAGALSVAELGETQTSEEKHDNNKNKA